MSVFPVSLLYQDVQDQFTADGLTTKFAFGWREIAKQGQANRVVFVPGEPKSGKAGAYGPARYPGTPRDGSPRHLSTFHETVQVYCWGVDLTDAATANNEQAQYEAARDLHDSVVRAIYLSPTVKPRQMKLTDPTWVTAKLERRFGAEIMFTVEIENAIVDEPSVAAPTPSMPAPTPETATGPAIAVFGTTDSSIEITDGTDTTTGT
jgi:hypothetical protein